MPKEASNNPSQFRILFRVFYLRVVDLEVLSGDGDTQRLLGQFAALFAAVSLLFTVPLIVMGGRPPQFALWTAEHLFIATTMVVVGLLSVMNWDSAFPDRRDILVLSPLPIHTSMLFRAKLSALAAVLSFSIVALNSFTGLTWAFLFSPIGAGFLGAIRSVIAYWTSMFAAGGFIFCSVLNLQGLTALLLPRQYFLRISALLQVAAFSLLLGVYFLEPSLESTASMSASQNQWLLACLPSYWFLGLFQQLNGSMQPEFAPLVRRAWTNLAVAVFLAGGTLLLSWFQTLRKTIEEPDILPSARRRNRSLTLGNSLQTAVMLFSFRSLMRSRQHRVILSFYLGVGFVIVLVFAGMPFGRVKLSQAATTAQMNVPTLAASILMMCVVVGGVRVVSAIPISLRANWIFRITELRGVQQYMGAIRRSFLVLGAVPVWLAFAALFSLAWPLRPVFEHLLILAICGAILVQLCTLGSRKIPFTCSYLPGKGNLQFVFWGCATLLVRLVLEAARIEKETLDVPLRYAAAVVALLIIWAVIRWRANTQATEAPSLYFEDTSPTEILSLKLGGD